jgi:hypothetical protein
MKKTLFLPLLVSMVFLYSCEYQSSEVYNRPINRNIAPPQIQVVELNIDEDTLFIYWSMEIKFKFHSDNQAIQGVRFSIDGVDMGTVNSETGTFNIPGYNLGEGLHELSIDVYTASGTGSFADEFGAESFVFSKSWKMVIQDNYEPVLTKSVEDGLLHIKWKPYHASNFKEYIIGKWGENSYESEITRTKTNEFTDSSYVGEQSRYYISVISKDNITYYSGEIYLNDELPKMYFTAGDSNKFLVKWSRPKYYNAVDSFVIFQNNISDYYNTTRVKSTHNINDTSCRITEGLFGELAMFRLRLVPKKINIEYFPAAYDYFESKTQSLLGFAFKLPGYYSYGLRVNKDEFIYYDCDTLTRYSISQHRAVEKFVYPDPDGCHNCFENVRISGSGNFLISYVGCTRDILLTRGSDLQQYSVHKLQYITRAQLSDMAVSDSGTAIVCNSNGGFTLYNLVTSTPIGYYGKNYNGNYTQQVKISPTGEYFFAYADSLYLVQRKNGQFTNIWKANAFENKYYSFDTENPNRLVIWNGSKLSVRLCNDFSLVTQFALSDDGLLDIDYAAGEILTYSTGHFYVRSLSDGSLVKDVPTYINPLNWPEYCYLVDHTIVYSQGLLYSIQ